MTQINNAFFNKGRERALEGMCMVRPIEIPEGTVLYRYYDRNRARTAQQGMCGVWWLEYEAFQHIKHFALRNGYSQSYASRLFAAILYEWSEVNAFVACQVTEPLRGWKGRGRQVKSEGKDSRDLPTMTPMQGMLEVYQVCVPGLDGEFSLAPRALKVVADGAL